MGFNLNIPAKSFVVNNFCILWPTLARIKLAVISRRFIPACAGNRLSQRLLLPRWPVHPRVCGEQPFQRPLNGFHNGSSPRVRGTVRLMYQRGGKCRFIPACAGNSYSDFVSGFVDAVHPRVCGEQIPNLALMKLSAGSSPRVRGTEPHSAQLFALGRFIPACAGNRCGCAGPIKGDTVHPRVCGEQTQRTGNMKAQIGSSPRVRGTAVAQQANLRVGRFIPACAGNRSLLPRPV